MLENNCLNCSKYNNCTWKNNSNPQNTICTAQDKRTEQETGQRLSAERWASAADNLKKIFPSIAERLLLINYEGKGREDADEFMDDAMLAITALYYVGNFANDKCRFMPMSEKQRS